jgi:SHS2 domain-containing protein
MAGFEIIEHTADVGIRANADTLVEVFEQTTLGLANIMDAWRPGPGTEERIEVEARDLGGLLVDWLEEVLFFQDSRDAVLTGLSLDEISDEVGEARAVGTVSLGPRGDEVLAGTAVKAITFHRLRVEPAENGWIVEVYVDV